ncbi:hypothetical protein GCM10007392_24720 [Saccharospirillum salsuginis]|uniref:Uncharacterized protein n=1 Tax=Saccharospirillum salsuginis TaxID=418750 RepID=A0A918NBD1_9GAMM|nr:hypothetical protein GCM10007392_24720 [Saccharospirillum salsuginis]
MVVDHPDGNVDTSTQTVSLDRYFKIHRYGRHVPGTRRLRVRFQVTCCRDFVIHQQQRLGAIRQGVIGHQGLDLNGLTHGRRLSFDRSDQLYLSRFVGHHFQQTTVGIGDTAVVAVHQRADGDRCLVHGDRRHIQRNAPDLEQMLFFFLALSNLTNFHGGVPHRGDLVAIQEVVDFADRALSR